MIIYVVFQFFNFPYKIFYYEENVENSKCSMLQKNILFYNWFRFPNSKPIKRLERLLLENLNRIRIFDEFQLPLLLDIDSQQVGDLSTILISIL